jgi:ABC-type nitrate/sulfonate/bicarbonate transport system substrate-binding protein
MMMSPARKGISSSASMAIIIILVMLAAAGWAAYAAFPSTKTVTTTVGSSNTVTQTQTTTVNTQNATQTTTTNACPIPSTLIPVIWGITGAASGVASTYFVAQALGFYEQQGLSVTEETVSSTVAYDGLVSGKIQFIQNALQGPMGLYVQGENVVAVMDNYVNVGTTGIVVLASLFDSGKVTNITDLTGLNVGVLSAPAQPWYVGLLFSKYFGTNWTQIGFGSYSTMAAALHTGQISAAISLNSANTAIMEQVGPGVVLLNSTSVTPAVWAKILSSNGYPVPTGGVITGSALLTGEITIQQDPAVVQKFVNALTEASYWIASHNATQVLQVALQDPFMAAAGNFSIFLPDVTRLKNNINQFITPVEWQTSVYFTLASNPALSQDENQLINAYSTLVNMTFWDHASWCDN